MTRKYKHKLLRYLSPPLASYRGETRNKNSAGNDSENTPGGKLSGVAAVDNNRTTSEI